MHILRCWYVSPAGMYPKCTHRTKESGYFWNRKLWLMLHNLLTLLGHEYWINTIWPFFDLSIYSFIPTVILVIINSAIIYRTVTQRNSMKVGELNHVQIIL